MLTISNSGTLTDSGTTVGTGGDGPLNITFHHSGNYAFVANNLSSEIAIFDTSNPALPALVNNVPTNLGPQTIVDSEDGTKVYVLTANTVNIFNFSSSMPYLTLSGSFNHGLGPVLTYFGVDQMALDVTQNRLFISLNGVLAGFETDGSPLGNGNESNGARSNHRSRLLNVWRSTF
ncbi:hypothetical protein LD39_05670 [Halobacillus sp. BBL2006]|nr:hypothetical protein LD39_05670 [Halobacillus sp. BBL2006]